MLGLVHPCQQFRHGKSLRKELLKLKTVYLVHRRDALKEEMVKELTRGGIPTRQYQTWLEDVEKIKCEVDKVLNYEMKSSHLDVSFLMKQIERLMDMLDEIADQQDKPPFEHGSMIDTAHGLKRMSSPRINKGESFGPANKNRRVELRSEAGTKAKQNIVSEDIEPFSAPFAEAYTGVIGDKKKDGSVATEGKVMPVQREAKTVPVAEMKGGITPPISHITHPKLGISSMRTEIELIPTEMGRFPIQGKEILETIPDVSEENCPIDRTVNETICRETEGEDHMKSKIVLPTSDPSDKEVGKLEVMPKRTTNSKRSVEFNMQRILEYMRGFTGGRIRIYGNGGIFKTVVLQALMNHQETKCMFDLTIWVSISRCSGTREIQCEVARQLSLCLAESETDWEVARKLFDSLKSRKFLLLLDNVRDQIDLDAIGIPNPNGQHGCWIVLMTRTEGVYHDMVVHGEIKVEAVSKDEAWNLFHSQVGGIVDSPDVGPLARAMVEECGGFPLTIIVIGRALRKENDILVWKHALREFLLPSTLGLHGIEAVIQQLQYSNDKPEVYEIKDCFLYCALLGEDVAVSKLIDYFVTEGLVTGNVEDARMKGNDIVNVLLDASLLESTGNDCVKMNGVIKELALGIISSEAEGCQFLTRAYSRLVQPPKLEFGEGKILLGNSSLSRSLQSLGGISVPFLEGHELLSSAGAGLAKLPSNVQWEQAKMIFLMDNELSSLSEIPNCPHLLALFLQRNYRLRAIHGLFFDCMPSLQVLNLSKTRIKSLPQSLSRLANLKVLILRNCECLVALPPEIEQLKHLEFLDLEGTEIYSLPKEIRELVCLKHLQVSFYGPVHRSEYDNLPPELVSSGIISKLLALKELSLFVCPGDERWNENAGIVTAEMGSLKELNAFCFYFPRVEFLQQFIHTSPSWKRRSLTKFKFVVGRDVRRIVSRVPNDVEFEYSQQDRCLRFVNDETEPDPVLKVLTHATAFYLDHHLTVRSLSKFGVCNFNSLKLCIVRECPEICTIINGMEVSTSVFPLLEHLSIHYLSGLSKIWEGPVPIGSFSMLKFVSVHTCPKLTFILTFSMLQSLTKLEVLVIEDCPAVTNIVQDEPLDFSVLEHPKLRKLILRYLPKLVSIWKGFWPTLEHISIYNCPNLENLLADMNFKENAEIKVEQDCWEKLKSK